MSEAISSVVGCTETDRASPEEFMDEIDIDILCSSDCIEDIKIADPVAIEKNWVVSEERKSFFKKVIKHWKSGDEREVYLSFWDYAGQTTYYSTHQAFMSPHAVYLIVFDLSKDFDTKLTDNLNFRAGFSEKSTVRGKVKVVLYSHIILYRTFLTPLQTDFMRLTSCLIIAMTA